MERGKSIPVKPEMLLKGILKDKCNRVGMQLEEEPALSLDKIPGSILSKCPDKRLMKSGCGFKMYVLGGLERWLRG